MRLLRRHLLALALTPDPAPLSLRETAALFLFHLAALLAVCRLAHWPLAPALLLLGAVAGLQFLKQPLRLEALAPLGLLYGVTGLRLGIAVGLRLGGFTHGGLAVPEPLGLWLSYEWTAGLAILWGVVIELARRLPQQIIMDDGRIVDGR